MFAFVARTAETTNSSGVFTLAAKYFGSKNSGDVMITRVDFAQVALRVEELLRRAIDQRRRRLVGDEPLRELERDVMRRRRMHREQVEQPLAFLLAVRP